MFSHRWHIFVKLVQPSYNQRPQTTHSIRSSRIFVCIYSSPQPTHSFSRSSLAVSESSTILSSLFETLFLLEVLASLLLLFLNFFYFSVEIYVLQFLSPFFLLHPFFFSLINLCVSLYFLWMSIVFHFSCCFSFWSGRYRTNTIQHFSRCNCCFFHNILVITNFRNVSCIILCYFDN